MIGGKLYISTRNLIIQVVYPCVRNYLLLKGLKKFLKNYSDWRSMEDLNRFRLIHTYDSVDIIPYVNATTACNVLKLRGGDDTVGFLIAGYKILSIIEKYTKRAIPVKLLVPVARYIEFRNKHTWVKVLEDILAFYSGVLYIGNTIAKSNSNPSLGYTTDIGQFEIFLNEEGIDPMQRGEHLNSFMRILSSTSTDESVKKEIFKEFQT